MTPFEIPLSPKPQSFFIQLGEPTYSLTVKWNDVASCWVLDIADADQVPVLAGIPLVTGVDLLAQHRHLGFSGSLVVQTDNDADAVPTLGNLGLTGRVYFVVA